PGRATAGPPRRPSPERRGARARLFPLLAARGPTRGGRAGQLRQAGDPRLSRLDPLGSKPSAASPPRRGDRKDKPPLRGGARRDHGEPSAAVNEIRIGRALLSVSDKTGLIELANGLARHGVKIVSTGG